MEDILSFASSVSPLGIIALLVIVIYQLVGGKSMIDKIRGTQKEKYPSLEKHLNAVVKLTEQNELLLENHFKHEIPQMMESMDKIETKVDKIDDKVTHIKDRLIVLETKFNLKEDK